MQMPQGLMPTMNLAPAQMPAFNLVPPQGLLPMDGALAPNLNFDLGAQNAAVPAGQNPVSLAPFSQQPFVFYPETLEEPSSAHYEIPAAVSGGDQYVETDIPSGQTGALLAEENDVARTRDVTVGRKKKKTLGCFDC